MERLGRGASAATATRDRPGAWADLDLTSPVDRTKLFVCPTLTPLYYTPSYGRLSPRQALRYNQLMGMLHNEVITFFETTFAASVLGSLSDPASRGSLSPDESACLRQFIDDEAQHTAAFRRLNRLSDPARYAEVDRSILQVPRAMAAVLRWLTRRPRAFPMVIWVMLVMEERSLEISRRYAAMDPVEVEPHYAAAYRRHSEDEARHVQIDWHLIERVYAGLSRPLRRLNAALLRWFVEGFFLTPARSTLHAVDLLVGEFPELTPIRPRLMREMRALRRDSAYRRMMYSPAVNPITYGLARHFPELAPLRRLMAPAGTEGGAP